jgi:multiple sugar transport system permease protein
MKARTKEAVSAVFFILPSLTGFVILFAFPFIKSIGYCFTKGIGKLRFVGLENFTELFSSASYVLAIKNTIRFNVIAVPLIMAMPFFLALLLVQPFKGRSVFHTFFIIPLVIPVASIVKVWDIAFRSDGAINNILLYLKLAPVDWMGSSSSVLVLVLLYLWKNIGYNVILFQAGLAGIAKEYYESACIDGAGRVRCLTAITIPLIKPAAFFVLIISIINSFKVFREAYLLEGRYPEKNIYLLQHFMNNNFFNLNYQRLSTAALVMFAVIYLLVFLLFRVEKSFDSV